MKSWISPKAKKGLSSKINGVGLFAVDNIAKDEIVAVKAGHILNSSEVKKLNFPDHPELQIADDLFICPDLAQEHDDSMIFINHSCNPNVGMRGDIVMVAMRPIMNGEELVIDYAMIDNNDFRMLCNCGSDNCRKIITGKDHKQPSVKRYGKYRSSYISSLDDNEY